MKKAKAPKAPDYTALANQQSANDIKNWNMGLDASRIDQSNPFGKQDWSKDPTSGQWSMSQSLAPEYEDIRQGQAANQGALTGKVGENIGGLDVSQIDLSGAPDMPTVGGYNQQAIDTIKALQQPGLDRARSGKEAQLAAMGLGTGSGTAWNTEQQNIGDRENRAGMEAILAGINQGNTEFNQGVGLHTTRVNDILRGRQANLEQSKGLLNMNPQVTMPQFQSTNVNGPGNSGNLMHAGQLQYNASMNAANAKNSGGMGG